jgi:hypothetical protein
MLVTHGALIVPKVANSRSCGGRLCRRGAAATPGPAFGQRRRQIDGNPPQRRIDRPAIAAGVAQEAELPVGASAHLLGQWKRVQLAHVRQVGGAGDADADLLLGDADLDGGRAAQHIGGIARANPAR